MRVTRRGGAAGFLWSVVIGGVAAAWLYSSQIAVPGDLADVREESLPDPVAPIEPATKPAYPRFAGHRLRRRGWVLRRVLLLADAVAFLAAVALVDVLRADIALADPVVLGFGLAAFCG